MPTGLDFSKFRWIHQPGHSEIKNGVISITTDPQTDFWQRTYYDFRHDNAHAFVFPAPEAKFTFSVKVVWKPARLYDQCGIVVYQDADNWCKASVEYENERFSHLGSVVTNLGYSDWATTEVPSTQCEMLYRLSRRGQDFLIQNSHNGQDFQQMRVFHMHSPIEQVNLGIYACSPLDSSFRAVFSDFSFGKCLWEAYVDPQT